MNKPPARTGAATDPHTRNSQQPDLHSPAHEPADALWDELRSLTAARIGLSRVGASQSTNDVLRFAMDHARARDAVAHELDVDSVGRQLTRMGCDWVHVSSAAPDRACYLLRPDLGRRLSARSRQDVAGQASDAATRGPCHVAFVLGDGLSAQAVQDQAGELVLATRALLPASWTLATIAVATQARVAIGDEIGELLQADLVAILIGERPGLSAADSMGVYLTWEPRIGLPDSRRNCISNVRERGLSVGQAARRLAWLMQAAASRRLSGVTLKDRSDEPALTDDAADDAPDQLPDSAG